MYWSIVQIAYTKTIQQTNSKVFIVYSLCFSRVDWLGIAPGSNFRTDFLSIPDTTNPGQHTCTRFKYNPSHSYGNSYGNPLNRLWLKISVFCASYWSTRYGRKPWNPETGSACKYAPKIDLHIFTRKYNIDAHFDFISRYHILYGLNPNVLSLSLLRYRPLKHSLVLYQNLFYWPRKSKSALAVPGTWKFNLSLDGRNYLLFIINHLIMEIKGLLSDITVTLENTYTLSY